MCGPAVGENFLYSVKAPALPARREPGPLGGFAAGGRGSMS